jgi:hypothetical protein
MKNSRLSDIIKGATEVNMRYSATLLNLSKDYLKAFSEALSEDRQTVDKPEGEPQPPQEQPKSAPEKEATAARSLLLLAGRKGEKANAAFAVNNTSQMSGSVNLEVVGDFPGCKVVTDPEVLSLKNGEGCIIRILADIGARTPVDTDHPGSVVIPELGITIADFVIRRLPDLVAKKKTVRRKKAAAKPRAKS